MFSPANSLFFHPRNKNLAIGSLIEALLYDMQRSHTSRFNQLKYLEEVADHCTLCGKCLGAGLVLEEVSETRVSLGQPGQAVHHIQKIGRAHV